MLAAALGLYNAGFDKQSVTDRSGHRNNAVQIYKRPSVEQHKAVSSALDVPDMAITSVGTCVKSEDGKLKPQVVNDANVAKVSSDNCLPIVLPSGITDVIIVKDGKEIKVSL